MSKNKNNGVKFPGYGVEIILKNDDALLFTLYYSKQYGVSLLVEDKPYEGNINPDEIMSNISEEEIIKEITILEKGISTLDAAGQRKKIPVNIKEIMIFENNRENAFTIAGSLVKYSKSLAEKYQLNEFLAYDYFTLLQGNNEVKTKIRKQKI